jgi:hypothetical protein
LFNPQSKRVYTPVREDELIGFISPTVYLSRYVPKNACVCGDNDWGRVTTFFANGAKWTGFVWCMSCGDRTFWDINPDIPIAMQGVKSTKPLEDKEET